MSRNLCGVLKCHESNIFNIERKLCKTINHKQLLCTYKKSKKYPKGMKLRFNLSLCNHNDKLKDACNNILNHASAGIRDVIIKALDKEVNTLKLIRNQTRRNIKTKTSRENHKLINKSVAEKIAILEVNIKFRHTRKQEREHIQPNIVARKRNRRFKKEIIMNKRKEKQKRYRSKKKEKLKLIKQNAPDQNAINLSKTILTEEEKSILIKGPSFVPTPTDINWYDVRKNLTKFANKLRHFTDENQQQQQQQQQEPTHPDINTEETTMNNNSFPPGKPPPKVNPYQQLCRSKPSNNNSLELFIDNIEKELFNPSNIRKTRNNLNKKEKLALNEMKSWEDKVIRVQDKSWRFVVLNTDNYTEKVGNQINRSSFEKLNTDPSAKFKQRVNNWLEKWSDKVNNEWKQFIKPDNCNAGKMYGMVKTHKTDNPVRLITSGCNTAVEKLSILVEKTLYPIADKLPSKIKDTNNMLDIIDNIIKSVLNDKCVLVSFDVVNMFPNIDNKSGLSSVKNILSDNDFDPVSVQCIIDGFEIFLTCNNSKFNNQHFLQTDGTVQSPHMSCSYADIAMAKYDSLANDFHLKPKIWKRFRDDIFTLWEHGLASLPTFLEHLNTMDKTGKIKFAMEVAGENGLEFLDLKLKIVEGKIKVDVYAKPTNSFSYTTPSTCYPKNNICNIPKGIALRLRRICDDDDTFDKRSLGYQNYSIARDHKPSTVKKYFSEVKNITRTEARKKQTKKDKVSDIRFITTYNPALPNINKIIHDNLSILYTDEDMKKLFPPNSIKTLYRRGKNLKEIFFKEKILCSHLSHLKKRVRLLVVINVTFVRII